MPALWPFRPVSYTHLNAIYEMIRDEIVVDESDEGLVIDLGTLNNTGTGKPTIRTSAYDGLSDDLYDTQISACLLYTSWTSGSPRT